MVDCSIIIVNYKTKGLLKYCLKGITALRLSLPHEIIIVDNASDDGSVGMLKERFPSITVIPMSRNVGFSAGVNLGIAAASGRYILILNADVVVQPSAIETLVNYLDRNPQIGIAGPQLKNPDGTIQDSCCRFYSPLVPFYRRTWLAKLPFGKKALDHVLMKDFDHKRPRAVDWILGGAMMIRKKTLDEVGLFDERFFVYFEDADLCRRFWEKGWKVVYYPGAVMIHYHQRISAEYPLWQSILSSHATRSHIASWIKYFFKYRKQPLPSHSDEAPV